MGSRAACQQRGNLALSVLWMVRKKLTIMTHGCFPQITHPPQDVVRVYKGCTLTGKVSYAPKTLADTLFLTLLVI